MYKRGFQVRDYIWFILSSYSLWLQAELARQWNRLDQINEQNAVSDLANNCWQFCKFPSRIWLTKSGQRCNFFTAAPCNVAPLHHIVERPPGGPEVNLGGRPRHRGPLRNPPDRRGRDAAPRPAAVPIDAGKALFHSSSDFNQINRLTPFRSCRRRLDPADWWSTCCGWSPRNSSTSGSASSRDSRGSKW